ncbi:MAG TPA: glycosyltransferase family 4 protein [Stellaceae bacterium]|nr:glycosyltransferase family 4 protein [Stellaceae bacterium]
MAVSHPHFLHVFPSFGVGGVPLRMGRIINYLGPELRHTVVALDGNFDAAQSLAGNIEVRLMETGRGRQGLVRTLLGNAAILRRLRPDLLITYNWGSIEWAMANRLWPVVRQMHCEAGFGKEEADRQIRRRVLFRRWALAGCTQVVVPSRRLERLACDVWRLPKEQVVYIPNGVDIERFSDPKPDAVSGFSRAPGELVVGTVAPLRAEKNVGRLLRVFARLDPSIPARLIIAGDGVERSALTRLASDLGIAARVVFIGHAAPEMVLGAFDVFALSSDTEQMPNALLEAMAAGRAVASVDVGDVKSILSEKNRHFVTPRDDDAAFAASLSQLLGDPATRIALGRANRERVTAAFSQDQMFAAYSQILGLAQS